MANVCISSCVDDSRVPVRATYVNLYKWPESDFEFVKTVSDAAKARGRGGAQQQPKVVDSISCRQMYLRSYTFSKKETVPEKTKKCFGKVRERVGYRRKRKDGGKKKCLVFSKVKEVSCSALFRIFNRLLSCTTSVDVVDQRNR